VARCAGAKPSGEPCERIVGAKQEFCFSHDPTKVEARRKVASKAGKSSKGGDINAVKNKLRQLADDVLTGEVPKGEGSVAAQILGVYLRACETELKVKQQTEFEERLEELERSFAESSKPRNTQAGRPTWRA
jgi:hypothetical protein